MNKESLKRAVECGLIKVVSAAEVIFEGTRQTHYYSKSESWHSNKSLIRFLEADSASEAFFTKRQEAIQEAAKSGLLVGSWRTYRGERGRLLAAVDATRNQYRF
jgi:hypothetical protein